MKSFSKEWCYERNRLKWSRDPYFSSDQPSPKDIQDAQGSQKDKNKLKTELKESFAWMKKSLPQGCPKAMDKVVNQDSGWNKEQC